MKPPTSNRWVFEQPKVNNKYKMTVAPGDVNYKQKEKLGYNELYGTTKIHTECVTDLD